MLAGCHYLFTGWNAGNNTNSVYILSAINMLAIRPMIIGVILVFGFS